MSRIGKKQIEIPSAVKVAISPEGEVKVEGPKGKLEWKLPSVVTARQDGQALIFERKDENRSSRALHGLSRSLVSNMIQGVAEGFTRDLEIHGVGFRAAIQGEAVNLSLGYSHPVLFPIPQGLKITVSDNTKIRIEGIDKQLVGQAAADIRAYYPPEPYKGKGVRYAGERILRKEGKTVQ